MVIDKTDVCAPVGMCDVDVRENLVHVAGY